MSRVDQYSLQDLEVAANWIYLKSLCIHSMMTHTVIVAKGFPTKYQLFQVTLVCFSVENEGF